MLQEERSYKIRAEGLGFLTALALSGPFSLLALALLRIETLYYSYI